LAVTPCDIDRSPRSILGVRHDVSVDLQDHFRRVADPLSNRDHGLTGVKQDADVVMSQTVT